MVTAPQLSVAEASPVEPGETSPSHSTVPLAGQEMLGASVSTIVMIWSQLTLFPHASVAVQVRVMTDSPGQLPATTTSDSEMVTAPQLSVAVAAPVAALEAEPSHSMVVSAAQVMTGAVLSTTVMI